MSLSPAITQSLGLSGQEIYATVLRLLEVKEAKGRLLDYGAGQGRFLKTISNTGKFHLYGADLMPCPEPLKNNVQWIQGDLNLPLNLDDETFDVISAIEVIEHLENPRATVREWKRLLRRDGTLIFSTPNNHSWRSILALIFRGHFVSFLDRDYPAHITALTKVDLERILAENGFKNIEFHFTNKGLVPGLPKFTWQKISFDYLKGKRFSDNIFVSARKA